MLLAAAGVGLWLLIVIAVLGLCRAASRADRQEDARRVARVSRRGATVGLAVVATTVPAVSSRAQARQLECADRSVPYQQAPSAVRAAIGDGGVGTRAGTPAGHASGVTVTMVAARRNC